MEFKNNRTSLKFTRMFTEQKSTKEDAAMAKVDVQDFKEKLVEFVEANYKGLEVTFQKVNKNNSVVLDSCVIKSGSINIAPTIYLAQFIREIEDGKAMEEVFEQILSMYESNKMESSLDISWFTDWESVRDKIRMKVINTSLNKECILLESPHYNYLDLSVVFYAEAPIDGGTIRVLNNHLSLWGISADELLEQAKKNLEKEEFVIQGIMDVIGAMIGDASLDIPYVGDDNFLYVISTKDKLWGSKALLDDEILLRMSSMFGGRSYYLIPSSVHELLATSPTDEFEPDLETVRMLKSMVQDVNQTEVRADEILSYSIYFYNADSKMVTVVG